MAYEQNGFNGTGPIHFTNVRILDSTGEYPYTGEVLIQGNRIKQVTRGSSRLGGGSSATHGGATVIDGMGATLMPGLIDAHLHLSWNNAPGIDPIQMMELEEHMLVTMEMAKLVLDAGFTAGRGAAAAKPRLDVVAKKFINEGRFPGPRYLAAGPEITTVGGLGDASPSHIPHEGLNLGIVVSGPEEVRRTVRQLIKYGVDSIKLRRDADVGRRGGDGGERGKVPQQGACRPRPLLGIREAVRASRHPEHLSRLLRRRRGARHAGSQQGQAFRRPRDCLAHQHRAACRALGHQAGLEGGDAL